MPRQMKPLSCDPAKIAGMSERLIFSHYQNNHGGAVKRLNMDFGAKAGSDVETFMGAVRWRNANQLFNETIGTAGRA
jgi:Fe-Mn family superoxide dismutase